jgi:hypothetical protein
MDRPVWFDDLVQYQIDAVDEVWLEPLPPDDGWFDEVEPVPLEEPVWMAVERAWLYDGVVGG